MEAHGNFWASYNICSFWPSDPRGSPWSRWRACPWGTAPGRPLEPLSDLDQLLSIVNHEPNVNAKQVVMHSVCNTHQRLVHPLPHTSQTRCPRRDASSWPRWELSFVLKKTIMFSEISVNVTTLWLILSGEHAGSIIYEIRAREPCSPGVMNR